MKLLIQGACLIYGCLALLASAAWFAITWLFRPVIPDTPGPVVTIFVFHGLVLTLTFHSFVDPKSFSSPIWCISERRRKWARGVLAGAVVLCIGIVIWAIVVAREPYDEKLVLEATGLAMASLAMLSSLYIVLHRAFRPENLFSESFIEFASNPLAYLLTRSVRR